MLTGDFSTAAHISKVLESCARSIYALRIPKSHGMPPAALHEVTRATTIQLLYAAKAWWGFALAADRQRIERFILRTARMGDLPLEQPDAESLVTDAENRLLTSVNHRHYHVLRGHPFMTYTRALTFPLLYLVTFVMHISLCSAL